MTYKSLEHSIRSVMLEGREKIKAVARPEDDRKKLENVPRENTKDPSAYTRMQEIKMKIVDEEYLPELTLEEVKELHSMISNLLDEKKKVKGIKGKIPAEEPEGSMGTKVDTAPTIAANEENIKEDIEHHNEMLSYHEKKSAQHGKIRNNSDHSDAEKEHSKAIDLHNQAKISLEKKGANSPDYKMDLLAANRATESAKKASQIAGGSMKEEVEFSEVELAHFNSVLEGRGRPKKDESNPNTASGRDPRQHIQVIAGQAAGGRNIEFTHNNGDKTTITPSMGRKIVDHLNGLKPADRQSAVNKMHASSSGLKLSEDMEQIDEFQGTIEKPKSPSQQMMLATKEKGTEITDKITKKLQDTKNAAREREFEKRQQTASTSAKRSAIKT